MATLAEPRPGYGRGDRFFFTSALLMALTIFAGFSVQLAMSSSSVDMPWLMYLNAFVFFGWVVLYVLQNMFVYRGVLGVHRVLGWVAAVWAVKMVVVGIAATVSMVQEGQAPFYFEPAYFLVMNSLILLGFFGLTAAAIVLRRQTEWHRRLHFCGMAMLTAPALGRLLPAPLLIPHVGWAVFVATLAWPVLGILFDLRRSRRVHDGWWWGIAVMALLQSAMSLIAFSGPGVALYDAVTVGTPGSAVPPLEFGSPPRMP